MAAARDRGADPYVEEQRARADASAIYIARACVWSIYVVVFTVFVPVPIVLARRDGQWPWFSKSEAWLVIVAAFVISAILVQVCLAKWVRGFRAFREVQRAEAPHRRLFSYIRTVSPIGVRRALRDGADPNWLHPGSGERPLTSWMKRTNQFFILPDGLRILRLLLDAGADQRLKNRDGQTIADVPVYRPVERCVLSFYGKAGRMLRAAGRLVSLQHLAWVALCRNGTPRGVPPVIVSQNRRWEARNPAAFNRLLRAPPS